MNGIKIGDFSLFIKTGQWPLERVTLKEAENRGLKETGNLTLAIACQASGYEGIAHISEAEIPSDAVAYRIGAFAKRNKGSDVFVPVAFYKREEDSNSPKPPADTRSQTQQR